MPCSFQIIAENSNGYIGQCRGCSEYNFVYKNILITFPRNSLLDFGEWLMANRDNPEFYFELAHGRTHIYSSPLHNFFLVFEGAELDEVTQLFEETKLILDARRIVGLSD